MGVNRGVGFDHELATLLKLINGNAYIQITTDPSLGVVLKFNPDTSKFNDGEIFAQESGGDADQAVLAFQSPLSSTDPAAAFAAVELLSKTSNSPSLVFLSGDEVVSSAFMFEGDGFAQYVTRDTNSAAVAPGNNSDVLDVTFDALAHAKYLITCEWHGVLFTGPVAPPGNRVTMRLATPGGTQLKSQRILGQNTTLAQSGGSLSHVVEPGANGSFTYKFQLVHEGLSTAATAAVNASGTSPASIMVQGFSQIV